MRVFVFSTFGKPRKKSITKEVLLAVTDKVRATTKTKDNDEGDEKATFWGEVCQELGIPDSKTNRTRLHHAYNHHKKMRHKTQMVTAPASPSTDSAHTACPIDSATDSDRTVPATPSSVTQAFTETSEPEDVSECNSSGTYDSSSHSKDGQLLHSFKLPSNHSFFFVTKITFSALLREYGDSLRRGKKTHRVNMERWKKRKQNRRGVYVTPINKPFVFRQHKKNLMQKTKTAKAPAPLQKQEPGETEAHIPSQDPKDKTRQGQSSSTSDMTEHAEDDAQGGKVDASSELTALWGKKDTEVVVSVVPTQIRGNSFTIRHSDMRTLRPHQWLTDRRVEEVRKHTLSKTTRHGA
ncbi:hypothetical protein CgunFtcFv8_020904 [Champsocephalus gunnari]|uniref:Uncharacterized protein n=1 Tax=Champsocephalus gunnari TaxID=52237 RepID=A0AAN8E5M3_CHAGU|nr:hypothetical protein CgunFtcFv8_020904 [Champsocephalus gunnari]